eukprot:Hpha_TRINITY_DN15619_c4_g3::TRINITY_DN15619_c4_g3_i1::g.99383::m.99383
MMSSLQGSVVASLRAAAAPQKECCCCLVFPDDGELHGCNAGEHHVCSDCLSGHLNILCEPDNLGALADGRIPCPGHPCTSTMPLRAVQRGLTESDFGRLLHAMGKGKEREAFKTAEREHARRVRREEQMNLQHRRSRHIESLRNRVCETLNLKCPRCGQVFANFDGCFALTCPQRECRAAFCAWCLEDCGKDAHAHVIRCPFSQSGGRLFASNIQGKLAAAHRGRRQAEIERMLAGEESRVRNQVLRATAGELREHGCDLKAMGLNEDAGEPGEVEEVGEEGLPGALGRDYYYMQVAADHLPPELTLFAFLYLDARDVAQLRLVSRTWNLIISGFYYEDLNCFADRGQGARAWERLRATANAHTSSVRSVFACTLATPFLLPALAFAVPVSLGQALIENSAGVGNLAYSAFNGEMLMHAMSFSLAGTVPIIMQMISLLRSGHHMHLVIQFAMGFISSFVSNAGKCAEFAHRVGETVADNVFTIPISYVACVTAALQRAPVETANAAVRLIKPSIPLPQGPAADAARAVAQGGLDAGRHIVTQRRREGVLADSVFIDPGNVGPLSDPGAFTLVEGVGQLESVCRNIAAARPAVSVLPRPGTPPADYGSYLILGAPVPTGGLADAMWRRLPTGEGHPALGIEVWMNGSLGLLPIQWHLCRVVTLWAERHPNSGLQDVVVATGATERAARRAGELVVDRVGECWSTGSALCDAVYNLQNIHSWLSLVVSN